jgi:F420-dependent oxidoreductase-like protein
VGEPYGNDAVSVLGWWAATTQRIRLGSSILAMPGRSAAMTAQTAATLDLISGGRLVLGLGSSGPQVSEGWHGVPFARQLQRTREYVEVVRMALRRERVAYDGETIRLPLPGGEGKPLKLIIEPPRAELPIYLAALGPRNTALCGQIADGWIPLWYAPEHAAELRAPLHGAGVEICPMVPVRIQDDHTAARDLMRPMLALYVGGMGSRRRNFYKTLIAGYGYEEVAERVQELYLEGRKVEAAAALPDELIDMVCVCGPPGHARERLAAYADSGVSEFMAIPVGLGEDRLEQLRLLAEAAA